MRDKKEDDRVICECGYQNKVYNIKAWGTCTRCRKILDEKAYFRYVMNKKLRLWRGKLR